MTAVDPHIVRHLTMTKVKAAASELGLNYLPTYPPDVMVCAYPYHHAVTYFAEDAGTHLIVLSTTRRRIDFSLLSDAARLIAEWNHRRIGPGAFLTIADDGTAALRFRSCLRIDDGLSPAQLSAFLHSAHETTLIAMNHFLAAFPRLRVGLSRGGVPGADQPVLSLPLSHLTHPPPPLQCVTPTGENPAPIEVTPASVTEALTQLGVKHYDHGDQHITTAFNGVPIAFFLETGPTLSIRAFWFPDKHPHRDFMRSFLICNQANEVSATTTAFPAADQHGLQIQVQYSIPTNMGLTPEQLRNGIINAVHLLLESLHDISTDSTGESAVQWPPAPS